MMDGDTGDSTNVTDAINGESKPDIAKLAQSAIIKQVSILATKILPIWPKVPSINK